jgi:hypothetical protein
VHDTASKLALAGGYLGVSFAGSLLTNANEVLLQQINRGCQQYDILHQERGHMLSLSVRRTALCTG